MSGYLRFLALRTIRSEAGLMRLSVPLADLRHEAAGRTVALVGNARALSHANHGSAIDAADIVIRINRAPIPATRTHGSRTDWLALATRLTSQDLARIRAKRILWMSHKRKRLTWRIAAEPGFYLSPPADFARLSGDIGAPPTTGLMMIDLLAGTALSQLSLYGFDFFASLSLTGHRSADQVPHDFASEKRFVEALAARDARIRLVTH